MTEAVFVEGPRRSGQIKVGYRPKTGEPRDAQGRLIIVWEYDWPPGKGPRSTAAPEPDAAAPPPISRGVRAQITQGTLI